MNCGRKGARQKGSPSRLAVGTPLCRRASVRHAASIGHLPFSTWPNHGYDGYCPLRKGCNVSRTDYKEVSDRRIVKSKAARCIERT